MARINKEKIEYTLLYTVCFTLCWIITYGLIVINGKTLIWNNDCLAGHFEGIEFRHRVIMEVIHNLIYEHRFSIPFVNFNLTQDTNIVHNIGLEIFDIILWFIPQKYYEIAFLFVNFLRLWCAGLCFSELCFYKKHEANFVLLGSLVYTYSCYGVIAAVRQPYFIAMFCFLPLILLGIEKALNNEKSTLLIWVIFLNSICTLYFLFYDTMLAICYYFLRFIQAKGSIREKIKVTLHIVRDYLWGISLGAFIVIPLTLATFSSSRLGESVYYGRWYTYGAVGSLKSFLSFFSWRTGFITSAEWGYYGFLTISLFPILYLFIEKKKKCLLIILLTFTVICMNIPLAGKIFGLSTVNNRWSFCLALIVAYITTYCMPKIIKCKSKKGRRILNLSALFLFILLAVSASVSSNRKQLFIEAIMILITIAVINILWVKNYNAKICTTILLCTVFILVAGNAVSMEDSNFLAYMVDKGKAVERLESYIDYAYTAIEDTAFHRVEKDECVDEMSCNLPYWFGYNGISSTGNFINPYSLEYYHLSENVGLMKTTKVSDLDGRITDEALACVKYFLSKAENNKVPYKFEYFTNSGTDNVYHNPYVLPIGYTYKETVSYDEYAALNVAEQQEILLKNIVLNIENQNKNLMPDSRKLKYEIVGSTGISEEDGKIMLQSEEAQILLQTDVPASGELYVELLDVCNNSQYGCTITAQVNEYSNDAYSPSYKDAYSNRQKDFAINMGSDISGKVMVAINFSSAGRDISVGEINIYTRALEDYEDDIRELRKESLENVCISTNRVSGDITSTADQWLCFSIPYDKGWTCYLNGKKVKLYNANIMYMAVPINVGDYHVELKYFPYGMRVGIGISLAGLLMLVGYSIYMRIKNKM